MSCETQSRVELFEPASPNQEKLALAEQNEPARGSTHH